MTNLLADAAALTDDALLARVHLLASQERLAACELVAHLAELDTRKVLVAEGYSLFTYCTTRLGLSEDAAYTRVEVARAARRFPVLLDGLADGSLNLTTIRMLGRHLTADNHAAVLARARRRSKREIEVLGAQLAPRPDAPSSVRRLPVPVPVPVPVFVGVAPAATSAGESDASFRNDGPAPVVRDVAAPTPRPSASPVVPLSPERYRLQLTVGQETHDTLRRLQDLLRRDIPSGDPAAIVAQALALLLRDVEKRKLAASAKPRPATRSGTARPTGQPARATRHIPAAVRRAVWRRDGSRCAHVSREGHRCPEGAFLEVHHIHAHALGGPSTLANLALRCHRHNLHEAELVFGPRSLPAREAPSP